MNTKDRIKEILSQTHLMSLATHDLRGLWVSDVIFVYDDDFNIYWMSDPDTRHSKAILGNNKVAGTITLSIKSKEPNLGIQFSGIAHKIEGARYDLACKHLVKRGHPQPLESDDVLKGRSWYMLKPDLTELIDEANFGFKKQKLEM